MSYPVLCGAVVLTSANNQFTIREGATFPTATITPGTYYLRGNYTRNVVTRSENFAATWTLSANCQAIQHKGISPRGGAAYQLHMTTAVGSTGASIPVSFSGNGTKTVSAYLRPASATITDFDLYDGTAVVDRHVVRVSWSSAGVPTLSTIGGSGTLFAPINVGGGWYRISFTVSSVVGANNNILLVYPAGIPAAVGSTYFWGVQAEDRASLGDYVATDGAALSGPSDDLALALKTALESASASTNTYEVSVVRSINPATIHTALTVTPTGVDAFAIAGPLPTPPTMDLALFGMSGDFNSATNLGTTSQIACAASWVANDVAREIEPYSDRIVSVPRAASGRVQGVSRSSRMQSWRLGLSFVDERRMLIDRALSAPSDTLEGFIERFGAGASFELHEVQDVTGTTLGPIGLDTLVDVVHFSEDTLTGFRPQRIGPGVPLYSVDLTMHAKV